MIIFRHVRMNRCAGGTDCIIYGMFSVKKVRLTFTSLSCFCVTASCKATLTFRGITVHHFIVNLTLFTELLLRVFFLHSKGRIPKLWPTKKHIKDKDRWRCLSAQTPLLKWLLSTTEVHHWRDEKKNACWEKCFKNSRNFVLVWCLYLCFVVMHTGWDARTMKSRNNHLLLQTVYLSFIVCLFLQQLRTSV